MIHRAQRFRPAFTLLEVILSLAISMILLGSLYVAMNIQLRSVQAGRDLVEQSTAARAVLNRMVSDISRSLGAVDPIPVVTLNGTTQWTSTTSTGTTAAGRVAGRAASSHTPGRAAGAGRR